MKTSVFKKYVLIYFPQLKHVIRFCEKYHFNYQTMINIWCRDFLLVIRLLVFRYKWCYILYYIRYILCFGDAWSDVCNQCFLTINNLFNLLMKKNLINNNEKHLFADWKLYSKKIHSIIKQQFMHQHILLFHWK